MTNLTRASHFFFFGAVLAAALSASGCLSATTDGEESGAQTAALTGGDWLLVELDGKSATADTDEREPFIAFSDEGRVSGFAGCNRFSGSFETAGNELKLSPLAATRMACKTGMDREMGFLQSLGEVERFAIRDDELSLFGNGEASLLRCSRRGID